MTSLNLSDPWSLRAVARWVEAYEGPDDMVAFIDDLADRVLTDLNEIEHTEHVPPPTDDDAPPEEDA